MAVIETDFHVHIFPDGMIPMAVHRGNAVNRAVRLGQPPSGSLGGRRVPDVLHADFATTGLSGWCE